jgi:quercetin dioxygenase-like cupin family protein
MGHVRRREGDGWEGVEPRRYAGGAERHVLAGAADGARQVELRVFRLPPGAGSTLERHAHEHALLILEGHGAVLLDGREHSLAPGDHVFVGAWEEHRLRAGPGGPLVFACTAPVDRAPSP